MRAVQHQHLSAVNLPYTILRSDLWRRRLYDVTDYDVTDAALRSWRCATFPSLFAHRKANLSNEVAAELADQKALGSRLMSKLALKVGKVAAPVAGPLVAAAAAAADGGGGVVGEEEEEEEEGEFGFGDGFDE